MLKLCSSTSDTPVTTYENNTIFYNFVGNFVPPEWRDLKNSCGKALSKTARQLLSLIVFRLQVYYNNCHKLHEEELQESYHFFEQSLGVCQRRIRQCMLELQEGGFISLYNATIIKQHIKCRNTPCIKLAKNFQPYPKKISHEAKKTFGLTRKKFQVDNIIDIDNKSNISRSSESDFLKMSSDENKQLEEVQGEMVANTAKTLDENVVESTAVSEEINKIVKENELGVTDGANQNNAAGNSNNGWFRRKSLRDFHPLTDDDADLLQLRSNREFNLNFINKLLLKLAQQYPNHHFYSKKVVMNYMVKALQHELRECTKVNNSNFQFKSNDPEKLKEQYLEKIERSQNTSKQAQLKRKIAGIFEPNTAYQLLTSAEFSQIADDQYQIKLLKDILLSEHLQNKILEQIRAVYGNKIKQLQVIPFKSVMAVKQEDNTKGGDKAYLLELNSDSIWCKVRKSLIERHGKNMDSSVFSKLAVIEEENINNKITLKPTTPFIDYWVKQRHMEDLRTAFQAQNFTFELLAADRCA